MGLDGDLIAQDPIPSRLEGLGVETRQGVGGDPRLKPLDHIAVVVIVGRLDQFDMEAVLTRGGTGVAGLGRVHLGLADGAGCGEYIAPGPGQGIGNPTAGAAGVGRKVPALGGG